MHASTLAESGAIVARVLGTDQACEATELYIRDAKHFLRWHAVAAGVALTATPIVYHVIRIIAQHHRAELVNAAKDTVQREELFNGADVDGVLIDPEDGWNMSISYGTPITKKKSHTRERSEGGAADGAMSTPAMRSSATLSMNQQQSTSSFMLRLGGNHYWAVSSFAHQVLAAQRAPNAQFVRACSRAAVFQYSFVVVRVATWSCVVSLISFSALYALCTVADHLVLFKAAPSSTIAQTKTPPSRLGGFFTDPIFKAAPPVPAVSCTYGLYDFSISAGGIFSRLFPRFGRIQTVFQRLCGWHQPLHEEWRMNAGTYTNPHALADEVWAALSPQGFFWIALLSRLPLRTAALGWWATKRISLAVMRRWHAPSPLSKPPPQGRAAKAPPVGSLLGLNPAEGAGATSTADSQRRRKMAYPKPLLHSPVAMALTALASDLGFALTVLLTTSYASQDRGSDAVHVWPLVPNAAGALYNAYCWTELVFGLCDAISF